MTDTYSSAGTYTWTAPPGVTSVTAEVWGAGGAGGGNPTNFDGGGGGGGGGYSRSIIAVTPGNSYTVTVGAGGAGVAGGNGNAGGQSFFINATTVQANGGAGGAGPVAGDGGLGGAGGALGVGTTRYTGGNGGDGLDSNQGQGGPGGSSAGTAANGTSGPSPWSTATAAAPPAGGGIGGNGGYNGAGSVPASGNGGGGGGSGDGSGAGSNRLGGNGADGQVILTYTAPPNVSAISPSSGPTAGGTSITITGAFFTGASAVSIGGVAVTSFTVVSDTTITAVTAANTAGAKNVVVTTPVGSGTGSNLYTYVAPPQATCNSGTITGVINTYYPGSVSVSAGATSITVGASSGAATGLASGDLILVMQMQDATIDTTNTASYGAASASNAGRYEYVTVTSVVGSTVNLSAALVNGYTVAAATGTSGQKTFQVIRVPVYSTGTLGGGITASPWNGSTGGVLAFDVIGALNLNAQTVTVDGLGFRGGATRNLTGGGGANTDYRTLSTVNNHGSKGEGIAGTPRYVFTAPNLLTDTGVEGYPNGSHARGAPASGGGGGTDRNPSANDQNTGGGGGGNSGAGGIGGIAWCPGFSTSATAAPAPYACGPNTGGLGGNAVSALGATRLTLGGGGGGGTTNNATGSLGALSSSGAAGGGIILLRAGSLSGSATFNANGSAGNDSVRNDGSGGGGAGGAVLISAASGMGGVTINTVGGKGGNNLVPPGSTATPHGPGGGGGGGLAITSTAPASCSATAGASGVTYNNGAAFGAYGASGGSAGSCTTNASLAASIPGAALGAGPCAAALNHYLISHSGTGITCEAEPVTFTAHDSSHARVNAGGRTIAITTSTSSGTWVESEGITCTTTCYDATGAAKASCGNTPTYTPAGTSTGVASYAFQAGESAIRMCLKHNNPVSVNINVSDGAATEATGTASGEGGSGADPDLVFSNTGIRIYADGNVDTIANQVAGVRNDDATNYPGTLQTLTVRALKSGETTPARCVPLLTSVTRTLQFAYRCESSPSTCSPSLPKGLEINGTAVTSGTPVTGFNAGSTPVPADDVSVVFDANGHGSINLKYFDVGNISLWARATSVPDSTTGSTFAVLTGNSNTFAVKPYDFGVIACTGTAPCATANNSPTDGSGALFAEAGAPFKATVTARAFGGTTAYSFGRCDSAGGTACPAASEVLNLSNTLVAPAGGATGTLGGTISTNASSFVAGNGVYTFNDLTWDEVGVMALRASNANYLGNGFGACSTQTPGEKCRGTFGRSGNIGRFYPAKFAISGATLTNACPSASGSTAFTYFGEDGFTTAFTITAQNRGNGTTTNYRGVFAKLNLASYASYGFTAATLPTGSSLSSSATAPSGTWGNGVTTNVSAKHQISRPTALTGETLITLSAAPSDGEVAAAATATTLGSVRLRYGRLQLLNAYGSELLDLPVTLRAQYWTGTGWTSNTDDSCTTVTAPTSGAGLTFYPEVAAGAPGNHLSASETSASVNASGKLASGDAGLKFSKPGAGNSGHFDISIPLATQPWLQFPWGGAGNVDPSGRATFGIYKSRLIYLRENY